MTRLRALNESSSDENEEDSEERETIEAQEERAFSQYKKALELRQSGCFAEAEHLLVSLLNDDFLADVFKEESDGADALARPAVALKYACLKNLGNVLVLQNNPKDGLKCYLQAVELDETDVSMWLQMGRIAVQIDNFHLASQAFQEGLRCNPHHWPCLDALLPILYAMNDYLGCLLLVSRTLVLDSQYPQALALRDQIQKEDPSLLQNFKFFFPEENDIAVVASILQEEEISSLVSHAVALQKRYCQINPSPSSCNIKANKEKLKIDLQTSTWDNLGCSLLKTYNTIISATDMSYLDIVEISLPEPSNSSEIGSLGLQTAEPEKTIQSIPCLNNTVDVENDAMDIDSEQDAKGEDQTEEDVTEASGLDQEDETKATSSTQLNTSIWKKKKKQSSTSLMDQWSKRRSGRRSGRKAEEREADLASCFRSLLPESLLPRNLEAELAKASRRRSLRDPLDLLALGDDSMDTEELCRLLQEQDAKDEQIKGQISKETITQRIAKESYFGTDLEIADVGSFVKENGNGSSNIIEILSVFILEMSKRHCLTWPSSLVPMYIEGYECMRKHIPFPSPFNGSALNQINAATLNASVLYCELVIDTWQQKKASDQDILGDNGLVLSGALGHTMLLSGLRDIFSTATDQRKLMLRIHWLKAHLFLLQENSPSAICSLQDVVDSLSMFDEVGIRSEKDASESSHLKASPESIRDAGEVEVNESVDAMVCSEEIKCKDEDKNWSESCQKDVLIIAQKLDIKIPIGESMTALSNALSAESDGADMEADTTPIQTEVVDQELLPVTPLCTVKDNQEVTKPEVRTEKESSNVDVPSLILPGEVIEEKDSDMKMSTDLKHESKSPVNERKESLDLGECIVKLEAIEEDTIDGGEKAPIDTERVVENEGKQEDNMEPGEEQESDVTISEVEKNKEIVESNTVEMVQNKDGNVDSFMTNSPAPQSQIQCEQVVLPISNEDSIKLLEKVDNALDMKTVTDVASYFLAKPNAGEFSDTKPQTLANSENEHLANDTLVAKCNINDNGSSVARATIVADYCINQTAKHPEKNCESSNMRSENIADKPLDAGIADDKLSSKITKSSAKETTIVAKTKEQAEGFSNIATCQDGLKPFVFLSNCRKNQEISKRMAQKLLTSLMRRQQLSEIDDLYSTGQYDTLASTLTECFKYCAQQADSENPEIDDLPDRATQMAMLLDCLWQLQRYSDCFYWAEACLHESFSRYLNSPDSDNTIADQPEQTDHQMWATTVERLLAGLNSCLKVAGLGVLQNLQKPSLTRLVQTLTSILCQQLEHSDCSVEMGIECITPWLILHRVIFFEELQLPSHWDSIPSHVDVLFTAHVHMGKKARCCLNEGVLLNLILDLVVPKIKSQDLNPKLLPILNYQVDQAILCLYGHPKKQAERNKKKLQDHRVHQHLELTWERSLSLVKFYEPDELPTFDSTGWRLSPEEEQLFLRILPLVPSDINPNRYMGIMKTFLKGSSETLPEVQCSIPEAAWSLYYLLADFYLKTFKWEPAVKFYMMDVCLDPNRFDSWAGMALSRGTLMYQDINSCDIFDNDTQLRRKAVAQRCFQLALDLDPENTTMWIEYGNFAYTTHSLCSRLLKTETESLSMEMFTKLEEEKDKMLNITEKCFKAAEKLDQDEGWLQQYMLGKVAEKRGEDPKIFLQHYRLAAQLLFDSNAEYPLTISYDNSQHYAFEAHEVHYRIHASILKHLELMEGKHLSDELERLYKEILIEASIGPFMAARFATPASASNAKRSSVDPVTTKSHKKQKLEEGTVVDSKLPKSDLQTTDSHQPAGTDDTIRSPSDNLPEDQTMVSMQQSCSSERAIVLNVDIQTEKGCEMAKSNTEDARRPEIKAECQSVSTLENLAMDGPDAADPCKENQVTIVSNELHDSQSSTVASSDNMEDPSVRSENSLVDTREMNVPQDLSKQPNKVVYPSSNKSSSSQPSTDTFVKSLDHADLIKLCLSGIEECLVRYPRHYKSFYRLCHHFFQSKLNCNFRKCRMLLLGDYRIVRLNKNISGLFKSTSVNSMFNDVWRMPIDEIDRAGSFASHMSRCVHLLMELLRAQRDHAYLLRLSIFLKRDPEKKEKKYLRDNERCELSKQALVMCLAAMRECAIEIRSLDNVIELYRSVKDGVKEMPIKDGIFKSVLCDAYTAYKKSRGLQLIEDASYEEAAEFCQKELALRKATAEAKAKAQQAQAAQTQMQVQALQVQAQAQAHMQAQVQALQPQAIQMGVNAMASTLPFSTLAPRFPAGMNPPMLGNTLASPMFLPQIPVHRGRGRPPKAQQQLHNAMMNMAHMIGYANTSALVTGAIDSSKRKQTKQPQKQRRTMQPASSSLNPVVSSIIKDRPALSITTLPNAVSMSAATNASSVGASSVMQTQAIPHPLSLASDQAGWQSRPRQNSPKPINAQMSGTSNARGNFTSNNAAEMHGTSRPKSTSKAFSGTSSLPNPFHSQPPRPFVPKVHQSVPLDDPTALLSRLPGLQVKQRSHQQPQQQAHAASLKSKDLSSSRHQQQPLDRLHKLQSHQQHLFDRQQKPQSHYQQPLDRSQKLQSHHQQPLDRLQKPQLHQQQPLDRSQKPQSHQQQPLDRSQKSQSTNVHAMSISKVSAPSAAGMPGNNSARGSELKKSKDSSFDVITLD